MDAVPNTYAALLNGPPKSMDIIPARTAPRSILLDSPIPERTLFSQVLNAPTGGFTIKIINAAMIRIPKNGYRRTGFVPSRVFGSLSNNFFNPIIRYPAANPAISAPKNPDEIHASSARNTEVPAFARSPPTIPGINAGLSPIAIAI